MNTSIRDLTGGKGAHLTLPLAGVLAWIVALSPAAAQSYQVTAISPLSGDSTSVANGINNSGAIVGTSSDADGNSHAFSYANGTATSLPTLGGSLSEANGISSNGEIAGDSTLSSGLNQACVWTNGTVTNVTPGAVSGATCEGTSVDVHGNVAVNIPNGTGSYVGATSVTIPGSIQVISNAVNNQSQAAGLYASSSGTFAFLYNTGSSGLSFSLSNTAGGSTATANGLNELGDVAGWVTNSRDQEQAAVWLHGSYALTLLGDLGGGYGEATSINNFDQAVGASNVAPANYNYSANYTPNGDVANGSNGIPLTGGTPLAPFNDSLSHAFIWQIGTMTDLNTLIPANTGWVLERATSINDSGQIVGYGSLNGVTTAFVLTPNTTTVSGAGTLSLSSATYSVNSNDGTVSITVTRAGGTTGAVTAYIGTDSNTVNGDTDGAPTYTTVTFANGQGGSQTITVPITEFFGVTTNQTFGVQLYQTTGGASVGSAATATVTVVATPYDIWTGQSFTGSVGEFTVNDIFDSAPLDDPANDGVPNLIKYALGLNPLTSVSGALLTTGVDSTHTYPKATFSVMDSATDVSVVVQYSADLTHWYSGPTYTTVTGSSDNGTATTYTVQSTTPFSTAPQQFMKLQVTRLP
jgi:probable HAF family extracellular repeat protein